MTVEDMDGKQGGIQVIARAADIMRVLALHPEGLSLGNIAQRVQLPRSTVQRIISALETEHFVASVGPRGGFCLGPAFNKMMHHTEMGIISVVRPYLEELSQAFQESAFLMKRTGDMVYVVDRVIAERELRIVFPIGINVPAHSTAAGHVLLASIDPADLKPLLPSPFLNARGEVRSVKTFVSALDAAKKDQFAIEEEEFIEGLCSASTMIDTYFGHYAVAVVVPTSRFGNPIERYRPKLTEIKKAVEDRVGTAP